MQVKDETVNIWGLEIEMQPVLRAAEKVWKNNGQELVITSGRDSIHSAGSLHYYGYAVDMRTRYFDEATLYKVYDELKEELPVVGYDIIVHKSHIHVEYDQ